MTTRYKNKEQFEIALRQAPPIDFVEIRNDDGTGGTDLPTVPYELVREIAELMYSEIIIIKNSCSIEPVMGLALIEMEIFATPDYPGAKSIKLFGNCMQRLINKDGKVLEPYMIQRRAESITYRDAFKSQGNIFGRNLRGKHGADFSLRAKEAIANNPESKEVKTPLDVNPQSQSPI